MNLESEIRKIQKTIDTRDVGTAIELIGEYYQQRLTGEPQPEKGDERVAYLVITLANITARELAFYRERDSHIVAALLRQRI